MFPVVSYKTQSICDENRPLCNNFMIILQEQLKCEKKKALIGMKGTRETELYVSPAV